MESRDAIITRLADEADQCRNDGADDIARLLDEAAAALAQPGPALVAAARLALEALEYHTEQTRPIFRTEHAITALRDALAAPAEPVEGGMSMDKNITEALATALQAYVDAGHGALTSPTAQGEAYDLAREALAAYRAQAAAPAAAAPAAQALTYEQIEQIRAADDCGEDVPEFHRIFRLAERAHGISQGGE